MTTVAVLLVDGRPVVRAGCRKLLERHGEYRVAGEAENAIEAYQLYRKTHPDIVVMDIRLPGASGLEAIRMIRGYDAKARILVFASQPSTAYAVKAFECGASGYVTQSSAPAELIGAMNAVMRGARAVSDDVAQEIAADRLAGRRSPLDELAPREVELLQLVASGMTTEAIAGALALSQKTVQNYHSALKAKLGSPTDAGLVWIAIAAGLVAIQAAD